ncbi:hypothetical protein MNBD_NITROSPIRAE03-1234 [hydrothermal vent metagenome]|uniref:GIY-YIG domain-containing protein n=1 Tax=hydrothermal vent metagenome TaxID=652676 RepID=A0A3B1DHI8_9ZZZZ
MEVNVYWEYTGHEEESIDYTRVLYAYLSRTSKKIQYIGKADYCSVSERMKGKHKESVFKYIQDELRLTEIFCIVGVLAIPEGRKYSSELLSDVESLLIKELQPSANIQSKGSRISRPGLVVNCLGDWPCKTDTFYDE